MKKKNSYLFPVIKKILSFVLSIVLVFGVLSFPGKANATSYDKYDLSHMLMDYYYPDDIFSVPYAGMFFLSVNYRLSGETNFTPFTDGWGGSYVYHDTENNKYYYRSDFTLPLKPNGAPAKSYIYVPTETMDVQEDAYFDGTESFDLCTYNLIACPYVSVYFEGSWAGYFYQYKKDSEFISEYIGGSIPNNGDDILGDIIGWSNSNNYINRTTNPSDFFVIFESDDGPVSEVYFNQFLDKSESGNLRLYPVYARQESTLEISVDDIFEGETPSVQIVSTNRPADQRNYTVKYEKYFSNNYNIYSSEISGLPTEPGRYKAVVTMNATGDTASIATDGSGMKYVSDKPYAKVTAEADFIVKSTKAVITTNPSPKTLEYNGSAQQLVTAGAADGGTMVYSFNKDEGYSNTIPTGMAAGSYVVWYKAIGQGGLLDSAPDSVTVTISPKTVGLEWFGLEFVFDNEEHCPSASATGLVGTDTCDVTVTGSETDAGVHTATAEELSNPNYALPSDNEETFVIHKADSEVENHPPVEADLIYNGEEQILAGEGGGEGGDMVYCLSEDGTYSSEFPVGKDAGEYTIWYKIQGDPNHNDSEKHSVTVTIHPKTVSLEWFNTEFEYDGEEHLPGASVTGLIGSDECDVTVSGAQKDAGTFIATATALSNSNYALPADNKKEFTITSAASSITAEPEVNELNYNGSEQELIKAGEGEGGVMVYSFSKDGTYSADIPKGRDASEYTIWYKIAGDANHSDSTAKSINVKINTKTIGLSWENDEFTYDGKEHCPTATATGIFAGDECTVTVTGSKTDVGTYTARASVLSNTNYSLPEDREKTFTIISVGSSIKTYPTAKELTYNGEEQELVEGGDTKDGEMVYSLSENGTFSASIPKAKDVGDYTVYFKVAGDNNHSDSKAESVKVSIAQKTVGLKWSEDEFLYDGKEHCPSAAATDLCENDKCDVTVTGAQKEIGIYYATASELSNKNYKLPKDNTKEFSIIDPEKLKGEVSVSMADYIYGGKASTPMITSKTNDVAKASVLYKASGNPDSAYRAAAPTEVGDYVVKVTLPENEEYNACSATASFSIKYLPVPDNAYTISGNKGDNGWYVSDVTITPNAGYEISYGDRNHFSGSPVKIADTVDICYIYIRNAVTFEQTSMISVGRFNIDSVAPEVIGMDNNGLYFADDSGKVKVVVSDANISKVTIDGNDVPLERGADGSMYFMITVSRKKTRTSFTVYDLAGNATDFAVITAPLWAKTGRVIEGELYLEGNEKYTFDDGTWSVDGDSTKYNGGNVFYVVNEGDYTIHKQ